MLRVRSVEEAELVVQSHDVQIEGLEKRVRDLEQRLETLQSPFWQRVVFRLDGWPGRRDLNAERPAWRPWRRWWTS